MHFSMVSASRCICFETSACKHSLLDLSSNDIVVNMRGKTRGIISRQNHQRVGHVWDFRFWYVNLGFWVIVKKPLWFLIHKQVSWKRGTRIAMSRGCRSFAEWLAESLSYARVVFLGRLRQQHGKCCWILSCSLLECCSILEWDALGFSNPLLSFNCICT